MTDTLFAKQFLFSFEGIYLLKREYAAEYKAVYTAGVNDGEVPPVPIPNTEVKLTCADNSWLETTCEDR